LPGYKKSEGNVAYIMSRPKLPWTARLAANGESMIEARLRSFSNPLKYELDVGIDFYCELLEDDSPTPLHASESLATRIETIALIDCD
jgi:hypothetical protein